MTPPPNSDSHAVPTSSLPVATTRRRPRRRIRPLFVLGAAVALTAAIMVAGAPLQWPSGHAAGASVGVGAGGDAFGPGSVTVQQGDTVTWNWVAGRHSVTSTSTSEPFDSGSLSAGTFAHTFYKAGTFSYLCVWHSGMTGTVVVTPSPSGTTTPGPTSIGATPETAGGATGAKAVPTVAAGAVPKVSGAKLRGTSLVFSLNNPATVAAVASGKKAKKTIATLEAKPGQVKMLLALNKLRPGRYTLRVDARNSAGKAAQIKVRVKVTWALRYRALVAQRAALKKIAASAAASVPAASAAANAAPPAPAAAPAATSTPATPAPVDCSTFSGKGHGSAEEKCAAAGGGGSGG